MVIKQELNYYTLLAAHQITSPPKVYIVFPFSLCLLFTTRPSNTSALFFVFFFYFFVFLFFPMDTLSFDFFLGSFENDLRVSLP